MVFVEEVVALKAATSEAAAGAQVVWSLVEVVLVAVDRPVTAKLLVIVELPLVY